MKTPPIRRCNICEALWVEGCDANQRAWWCKECKRVSDNCEAPAFIVRYRNRITYGLNAEACKQDLLRITGKIKIPGTDG